MSHVQRRRRRSGRRVGQGAVMWSVVMTVAATWLDDGMGTRREQRTQNSNFPNKVDVFLKNAAKIRNKLKLIQPSSEGSVYSGRGQMD